MSLMEWYDLFVSINPSLLPGCMGWPCGSVLQVPFAHEGKKGSIENFLAVGADEATLAGLAEALSVTAC